MASKFSRFNKTRIFEVDIDLFREGTYKMEDVYKETGERELEVVGIWRHEYTEDVLAANPGLPDHNYTLGVKISDDDFLFMFAPATMTSEFDEIMNDPSLIKEIKAGRCAIRLYKFKSRKGDGFAFNFC